MLLLEYYSDIIILKIISEDINAIISRYNRMDTLLMLDYVFLWSTT